MKKQLLFIVFLLVLPTVFSDVSNNENMTIYWTSDENSTWSNATNYLIDGSTGGTPVFKSLSDMVGSGYTEFRAGEGDTIKIINPNMGTVINFTAGCWFTTWDSDNFQIMMGRYDGDYDTGDWRIYDDDRESTGNKMRFQMFDGELDYLQSDLIDDTLIKGGHKNLIIFSVNQTLPNLYGYIIINDTVYSEASIGQASYAISPDDFTIGKVDSSATESWNGSIDECFFYNFSMSTEEIHYLWTNGTIGNTLNYTELPPPPPDKYNFTIILPTTASPQTVSWNETINIKLNFTKNDIEQSTGVSIHNVSIGGYNATINTSIISTPIDASQVNELFEIFDDLNDWTNDVGNNWAATTQQVLIGTNSAEIDGSVSESTLTLTTAIDLSGYDESFLNASIHIEGSFDRSEYICMDYSCDGINFNQDSGSTDGGGSGGLCQDGESDVEDTWRDIGINITQLCSGNPSSFKVRFRCTVSAAAEDGFVDRVNITGFNYASLSFTEEQQFSFDSSDKLWHLNISNTSIELSGSQDLAVFVNYTNGIARNHTQEDAIIYEAPPPDTCNPASPLTANHNFDCNDNCIETGTLDCNGFSITTSNKGSGSITFEQNPVNCVGVTLGCSYVTQKS